MRPAAPLRVYGSAISYFTGKLEAYLRYKEIPYRLVPMTPRARVQVARRTGTAQMPAVLLPDGRWMTDTTPMIAWFETQVPEPAVLPGDPLQAFASRLLEDYADEWLWRPALHYRWSHRGDALLLSRRIVDELLPRVPVPGWLKRLAIRSRQTRRYLRGDGVTAATRPHVESVYLRTLDQLEAILASRSFLLGARPSLADFGFFASMFRHFALDPTPAALMLARAPAVYAWVARLWNARQLAAAARGRRRVPAVPLRQRRSLEGEARPLRPGGPGYALSRAARVALPRLVSGAPARPLRSPRGGRPAGSPPAARGPRLLGAPVARRRDWLGLRPRRCGALRPGARDVRRLAPARPAPPPIVAFDMP